MKLMGASRVKRVDLDPCTSLWESESKQYTNFEFCEENLSQTFEKNN